MTLTTADLKKLATKSDLRKLATRSELQSTRSELQSTRGELKAEIKRVDDDILSFKNEVDEKLEKHQKRTENLIKKFTNKIINHIDAFLAELTNSREEQIIIGHQVANHEKRITRLEATP